MRVVFKDEEGTLFVTEAVEIVHNGEDILAVTSFDTYMPNGGSVYLKLVDINFEVPDYEIEGLIEQAFEHGKLDLRNYKCVQIQSEDEENSDGSAADYLGQLET